MCVCTRTTDWCAFVQGLTDVCLCKPSTIPDLGDGRGREGDKDVQRSRPADGRPCPGRHRPHQDKHQLSWPLHLQTHHKRHGEGEGGSVAHVDGQC